MLHALRRAARNTLELGIKTGTPVYVMRNNKIVDLTKDRRASKKVAVQAETIKNLKADFIKDSV